MKSSALPELRSSSTTPDVCRTVDRFFRSEPSVDVVFGDVVVVNAEGESLFHRKVQTPMTYHTWVSHLPALTCAMFFRRRVIDKYGVFFDPRLRDVGDADWVLRLLRRGAGSLGCCGNSRRCSA